MLTVPGRLLTIRLSTVCYASLMLAAYAVHIEQSRGRRYPETQHPYRNDFQRDRDRVIHARAFRRLEAKTQVFTRRYSDHFRNRLTHTLEVTQISRTIAGALRLNVDLAEALGLVHDIGHTPFGHAGEKALDACMRAHGLSFEHNLHALRIVEDFEQRYAAFRGLNLTFEVREGIIKHSHDYRGQDYPELAEYLLDERPPLEAQLIDLTDEIAYNTADLDDGYEAQILSLDQIRQGIPVFERFFLEVEQIYPDAPVKLKFNETVKRVLESLSSTTSSGTRRSKLTRRELKLWKMFGIIIGGLPDSAQQSMPSGSEARISCTRISTTAPRSQTRKVMRSA